MKNRFKTYKFKTYGLSLTLLLLIIFSSSFLLTGCTALCGPETQDIELGSVSFSETTLSKIPYPLPNATEFNPITGAIERYGAEFELSFENAAGEVIDFTVRGFGGKKSRYCIKSCQAFNLTASCSHYSTDSVSFVFFDKGVEFPSVLNLNYDQGIYRDSDGEYPESNGEHYDYLTFDYRQYQILDQSFSGAIDISRTVVEDASRLVGDVGQVTLNGKVFNNVFKTQLRVVSGLNRKTDIEDLYYSDDKGVVAFTADGELYTLVSTN